MEKTHTELSNKKGSLANCLLANKSTIEVMHADRSVSTDAFRVKVSELVIAINDKPLDKKSAATKRFLNALAKQKNKNTILMLVWNTIMAGDNEQVI